MNEKPERKSQTDDVFRPLLLIPQSAQSMTRRAPEIAECGLKNTTLKIRNARNVPPGPCIFVPFPPNRLEEDPYFFSHLREGMGGGGFFGLRLYRDVLSVREMISADRGKIAIAGESDSLSLNDFFDFRARQDIGLLGTVFPDSPARENSPRIGVNQPIMFRGINARVSHP